MSPKCKLLDHGKAVGADPMSDPEIQRFLGNLQSSLVSFITSEWADLVPAIVGNLIPAARASCASAWKLPHRRL
jgi:hypothetical protein